MKTGMTAAQKIEAILDEFHESKQSINKLFIKYGLAPRVFYESLAAVPSQDQSYSRAQLARAEMFADEIIDIADDESDPNKARNRINARQWYASKIQPKKYGDRIDLNVTETIDLSKALADSLNRARDVIDISSSRTGCEPVQIESPTKNADLDDLL